MILPLKLFSKKVSWQDNSSLSDNLQLSKHFANRVEHYEIYELIEANKFTKFSCHSVTILRFRISLVRTTSVNLSFKADSEAWIPIRNFLIGF